MYDRRRTKKIGCSWFSIVLLKHRKIQRKGRKKRNKLRINSQSNIEEKAIFRSAY
jgi:hypothetical protein